MLPYIHLFGKVIPMYGLCMATGLLLSSGLALWRARAEGGDVNSLLAIIACIVGCGIGGAKLLYLLVSCDPREVLRELARGDFTALANSGFVFYGGLIGGLLGALLGGRITGVSLRQYCAAVVPCVPLGHAFGRLGCFFAGCCYGRATDGPLGVHFPAAGIDEAVIPTQLIEAGLNLCLFLLLLRWADQSDRRATILPRYLMSYAIIRFLLEFLRGDEIRGFFAFLSVSQWISVALFLGCILWMSRNRRSA